MAPHNVYFVKRAGPRIEPQSENDHVELIFRPGLRSDSLFVKVNFVLDYVHQFDVGTIECLIVVVASRRALGAEGIFGTQDLCSNRVLDDGALFFLVSG